MPVPAHSIHPDDVGYCRRDGDSREVAFFFAFLLFAAWAYHTSRSTIDAPDDLNGGRGRRADGKSSTSQRGHLAELLSKRFTEGSLDDRSQGRLRKPSLPFLRTYGDLRSDSIRCDERSGLFVARTVASICRILEGPLVARFLLANFAQWCNFMRQLDWQATHAPTRRRHGRSRMGLLSKLGNLVHLVRCHKKPANRKGRPTEVFVGGQVCIAPMLIHALGTLTDSDPARHSQ